MKLSAGFTENHDAVNYPIDRMRKLWQVNVDGIELGTSVIPTYPRPPLMLASQALTVQSASSFRLCLKARM